MNDFQRATGLTYGGEGGLRSLLERTEMIRDLLRGNPPKLPIRDVDITPSAEKHGAIYIKRTAATQDAIRVCLQLADGSYVLRTVTVT